MTTSGIAAEFAGDGHQTGCPAGDQRQRAGEGVDVAVQAQQGAGRDAQQQRGDADADDHRPVRAERPQRVAMHHGADVNAEHALRGQPRGPWHGSGGESGDGQDDPDQKRGEQGRRGDAEQVQRHGDPHRDQYQQHPPHIASIPLYYITVLPVFYVHQVTN